MRWQIMKDTQQALLRLFGRPPNDEEATSHLPTNGHENGDLELRDPGALNYEKANRVLEQLVRDNEEWFKEMAKK